MISTAWFEGHLQKVIGLGSPHSDLDCIVGRVTVVEPDPGDDMFADRSTIVLAMPDGGSVAFSNEAVHYAIAGPSIDRLHEKELPREGGEVEAEVEGAEVAVLSARRRKGLN